MIFYLRIQKYFLKAFPYKNLAPIMKSRLFNLIPQNIIRVKSTTNFL